MSRIKEAFKDGKALIGFLTAGVPSAEDTLRYMEDLETAGADLIEIGVPFSDPVADGAVIMEADVQALKNKVHLPQVIEIVKAFRKQSETPLVFLTYYNPIFNYGVKKFFEEAKDIGLDGVAIPDLPYEEQMEIRPFADTYEIDIIQIIGPASEERICQNVRNSTGFIYIVSSVESANRKSDMKTNLADTFFRCRSDNLYDIYSICIGKRTYFHLFFIGQVGNGYAIQSDVLCFFKEFFYTIVKYRIVIGQEYQRCF